MAAVFTLPDVYAEVHLEVLRAAEIHGDQLDLPDGTDADLAADVVEAQAQVAKAAAAGELTWLEVLMEEFLEASAEVEPLRLRTELVQVAATAIRWLAAVDARNPLTVRTWSDPVTELLHAEVHRGPYLVQTVTLPEEDVRHGATITADPFHPGMLRVVRPEATS